MPETPAYPPIRRVVTGHGPGNVAKALIDGPATNVKHPGGAIASTLMWSTAAMPTSIALGETVEDEGARILGSAPPENGTRFTVMDFPPGNPPVMHRTETLDYVIVLEGEIDMDMDDSSVHLRAGDVLIQRGTNHSWVNRSGARCRLAVVLVDAQPLGIGAPVPRGTSASTAH